MYKCKTRLVLFGLLACAMLSACATSNPGTTSLAAKDAGTTVRLKQGDTLEISLEGNPTTGYTWEAVAESANVLKQQGEPAFKPDTNALGSGGVMTLSFKAEKQGSAPLKLIYHRTFEPGVAPLRSFEVRVVVE